MSRLRFAPAVFLVVFCCTYALVFAYNKPLFLYYPLHGEFAWGTLPKAGVGPAMAWYGLMTTAGLVALLASICAPRGVAERALRNYLWLFPCGAMLVCVFLLRQFFR